LSKRVDGHHETKLVQQLAVQFVGKELRGGEKREALIYIKNDFLKRERESEREGEGDR
jgi:hypothetical protein